MEFIPSVKDGINNYGMFTGNADRSQFWWFQLFFFLGVIIATIIDYLLSKKRYVGLLFETDPEKRPIGIPQ